MSVCMRAAYSPVLGLGRSGGLDAAIFFFLVTDAVFLSNVRGLYCGKLLNFFSNSSSSLPSL